MKSNLQAAVAAFEFNFLPYDLGNPLYKWTKDTIQNKVKKIKYLKSFTVYVKDEQLYEKDIADRIEKKILYYFPIKRE